MHVLRCLERFPQSSWTPTHSSPDRYMSLLHLHHCPKWNASAAAETKALGRGIRECFVPVSSIFPPDKMKLSVQLGDGRLSPHWQAVNTFRNTRKHTKRNKERSSSAFQVAASGHGSSFSNNPSKFCPVGSWSLKTCALSLVSSSAQKYYSLSNRTSQEGQLQCALDAFPWTTATKIAQVCCAPLKFWRQGLRNSPLFPICISLILLFFFPRRCSSSSAILVTKTCFSSASQSPARRLFFFGRKGSVLYLRDHNSTVTWRGTVFKAASCC